jgi:phosphopantetheinyl transferase (holo-ACP synthase)
MRSTGNDIVALGAIDRQRSNQIQCYSKILSVSEQALYARQDFKAMPFENFVWLLWSVKESAYKYLKRLRPDLLFAPVKIVVQGLDPEEIRWEGADIGGNGEIGEACETGEITGINEIAGGGEHGEIAETGGSGVSGKLYKGIVLFESGVYYFRSTIQDELIASVVSDKEGFEDTWWGVHAIGNAEGHIGHDQQSSAVRKLVLQKISAICGAYFNSAEGELQIGRSPLGYPVLLKGEEEMDIPVSLAHHDRFIAYSFNLPGSLYSSRT